MVLKFIYTLFIGILLALFVGVGISTFYKIPKHPEYPPSMHYAVPLKPGEEATYSAQMQKEQMRYERLSNEYTKIRENYQRNVSILALSAAIIILVLSLTLLRHLLVIADGMLLGGVFTLLYSIVRGFESHDEQYRFIVVSIGLLIALILGYIKFVKPTTAPKTKKSR